MKKIKNHIKKNILLTGGTGVLGHALLQSDNDYNWICLINKTPLDHFPGELINGDITKENFGISSNDYDNLASKVDVVIHAAAVTDFSAPKDIIFNTNVTGTENMLRFIQKAQATFFYLSTAFVHPNSHNSEHFQFNHYEKSKQEAEKIIVTSGTNALILKPSIIIGDSRTGAISRYQGLHVAMKHFMQGYLPVMIGTPQSYCDFVPQDFVAKAILRLIDTGINTGEYWLTSGEKAMQIGDMVEICCNEAQRLWGNVLQHARIVNYEMFERLIAPVFLPSLPYRRRLIIEQSLRFTRYFNIDNPFPSSFNNFIESPGLPPLPDSRITFIRNLEFMAGKFNKKYEIDKK